MSKSHRPWQGRLLAALAVCGAGFVGAAPAFSADLPKVLGSTLTTSKIVAPPVPTAAASKLTPALPPVVAPEQAEYLRWLEGLRGHYLALDNTNYRTELFAEFAKLQPLSAAAMLARLKWVLETAKRRNADGFEPLIIALADGIGARGTAAEQKQATAAIMAEQLRYSYAKPYVKLLEPIGRASTRLVLSVRPDVARAILAALKKQPTKLKLNDLLATTTLRNEVCAVGQPKSEGETLADLAELDRGRQQMCDDALGKSGLGSGRPDPAQAIGVDACFNVMPASLAEDGSEYTIAEQTADLQQCLKDIDSHYGKSERGTELMKGGGGAILGEIAMTVTSGVAQPLGEALGEALADAIIKKLNEESKAAAAAQQKGKESRDLNIQAETARKEQKAAEDKAVRKEMEAKEARDKADLAEIAVEDLNNQIRDKLAARKLARDAGLPTDGFDREIADLKQQRKAAQDKAEKLHDEAKDKEKEAEDARDAATKKKIEAEEAARRAGNGGDVGGSSDPGTQPGNRVNPETFNSAACNRLMANGRDFSDPVDMKRLAEDWATLKGRLRPMTNPAPDSPDDHEGGAALGLGLDVCGLDTPTTKPASDCAKFAHCVDPSAHCGCNAGSEKKQAEMGNLVGSLKASLCAKTHCGDGQPVLRGQVCACSDPDIEEPEGGLPPRPLPIEELFGIWPATGTASGGDRPLDNAVHDLFLLGNQPPNDSITP